MANYPYYQQPVANPQMPYIARPATFAEQAQPQLGIKGRPVSSIEEARAASIDFDGSVFFFPDLANKKIYTKQINMDGTAALNVYEWKNEPVSQYITREEFEAALRNLRQFLPQAAQTQELPRQEGQNKESEKLDF